MKKPLILLMCAGGAYISYKVLMFVGMLGLMIWPYFNCPSNHAEEKYFLEHLQQAIREQRKDIPLSELTNFQWRYVSAYAPDDFGYCEDLYTWRLHFILTDGNEVWVHIDNDILQYRRNDNFGNDVTLNFTHAPDHRGEKKLTAILKGQKITWKKTPEGMVATPAPKP